MDLMTRDQIQDKVVRILHRANAPGKDINSTILPPAVDK